MSGRSVRLATTTTRFTIPMRGNEPMIHLEIDDQRIRVYDPHEG